jgi:hypothetical protein
VVLVLPDEARLPDENRLGYWTFTPMERQVPMI